MLIATICGILFHYYFWLNIDLHMNSPGGNLSLSQVEIAAMQASISKDMFERFWLYLNFISRLMESCQNKCIANYKSNSLEIGEQVCVERCTKKWIEVYYYIVALQEPKAAK